jgi:YfiH family protein
MPMKRIRNRIVRYQFTSFQRYLPGLRHFITTRMYGFSQKPYDTLNVGLHVGDDPANVIKNRSLVCRELGFGIDSMVAMQQSHSANVAIIGEEDKGRGARQREDGIEDTDGIVTNSKNLVLSAMAADCSLNILYDPVKRVLALTHSGWKGIVSGVLKNTISVMVRTFGCHRRDILVGIGPTICEKCFEVGDDLIEAMEKTFPHRIDAILSQTRKGIQSINMIKALSMQLCDEGIESGHIEVSNICNACRAEEFFSYRMENKITGRFGLFAVLVGDDKNRSFWNKKRAAINRRPL